MQGEVTSNQTKHRVFREPNSKAILMINVYTSCLIKSRYNYVVHRKDKNAINIKYIDVIVTMALEYIDWSTPLFYRSVPSLQNSLKLFKMTEEFAYHHLCVCVA